MEMERDGPKSGPSFFSLVERRESNPLISRGYSCLRKVQLCPYHHSYHFRRLPSPYMRATAELPVTRVAASRHVASLAQAIGTDNCPFRLALAATSKH